jgi:hypothetical protein
MQIGTKKMQNGLPIDSMSTIPGESQVAMSRLLKLLGGLRKWHLRRRQEGAGWKILPWTPTLW